MEKIKETIEKLIDSLKFQKAELTFDDEHRRITLIIDDRIANDRMDMILPSLDHIFGLIFRKHGERPYVLDINYYRRERERLIEELARAAAKKAVLTKNDVELPAMNAYERRIVHMEIKTHPDLLTESTGMGKERRVVVKRIIEE